MSSADHAKITATSIAGRAKEAAGRLTHDEDLEIKGEIDRAAATARKNGEDEADLFDAAAHAKREIDTD